MRKSYLSFLIAAIALGPFAGSSAAGVDYEPVYITDGQFTATLDQHAHRWRLQPLRGEEIDITDHSRACGSRQPIPHGLWYVSQDAHGQPELVAPSVTPLPNGYPTRVALHVCGESADEPAVLFVPDVALAWINDHVGSVLIDD